MQAVASGGLDGSQDAQGVANTKEETAIAAGATTGAPLSEKNAATSATTTTASSAWNNKLYPVVLPYLREALQWLLEARVANPLLFLGLYFQFTAVPGGGGVTQAFRLLRWKSYQDAPDSLNGQIYDAYLRLKREDSGEAERSDVKLLVNLLLFSVPFTLREKVVELLKDTESTMPFHRFAVVMHATYGMRSFFLHAKRLFELASGPISVAALLKDGAEHQEFDNTSMLTGDGEETQEPPVCDVEEIVRLYKEEIDAENGMGGPRTPSATAIRAASDQIHQRELERYEYLVSQRDHRACIGGVYIVKTATIANEAPLERPVAGRVTFSKWCDLLWEACHVHEKQEEESKQQEEDAATDAVATSSAGEDD
ncbi:unnamed protein product [Amoebophrya sp. A25]|nr:unnamed protein product [Amoebophrya sp. A25]|eukprot:GSA25T00018285001.1